VSSDAALEIEPAVLTKVAGIRSYRKRLAEFQKQNPFDQQFTGAKPGQKTEVTVDDGSAAVSIPGDTEASQPVGDSGASSTSTATGGAPVPAGGSNDPSVSTGGGSGGGGLEQPGTTFYTGTVDLSFGPLGNAERYKNVKRFTNLPNRRDPVVAFLGLSVDSDRAFFLVSPAVTRVEGEGQCPTQGTGCQLLSLAVGEQETLTVGGPAKGSRVGVSAAANGDGADSLGNAESADSGASTEAPSAERQAEAVTYRLKLLGTEIVEITDPRGD
jgi:hypothetical protein